MRILRLKFKNIASFRTDKLLEIDFTQSPLSQHSLFLITGSTGAGKSTLLDAITVALYNRYSREKNTNNLLSTLAGNALIEVDYEKDGTEYRNVWKINRSYDKIDGKLQNSEMQLSLVKTNEILSSKKTEVVQKTTEILGLDFEQFTKTIILPQGDFANFLHAGDEVKIELFEKITDTRKYREFSQFVYERNKVEEATLAQIVTSIGNVEPLSTEEEQSLTNEIEKLTNENENLKEHLKSVTTKIQQIHRIIELQSSLQKIETELLEHSSKNEHFVSLEKDVIRAEKANEIVTILNNIKEQTLILHQKQEDLQESRSKKLAIATELTSFQQEYDTFSVSYDEHQKLVSQLYEQLPKFSELKNSIENYHTTILREEKEFSDYQKEQELFKQTAIQVSKSIEENSHEIASIEQSLKANEHLENVPIHSERLKSIQKELKNILAVQNEITTAVERYSEEIKEKSLEIVAFETKISENTAKKLPHTRYSDTTQFPNEQLEMFCKLYEEVHSKLESIKTTTKTIESLEEQNQISSVELASKHQEFTLKNTEYDAVISEISTVQLELKLHSFRSQLITGQPCPLCGSLDHSFDENVHTSDETLVTSLDTFQRKEAALKSTLSDLQRNITTIEQLQKQRLEAIEQFSREFITQQEEISTINSSIQQLPFPQNIDSFQEIQAEIVAREQNKFLQFQIENDTKFITRNVNEIAKLNETIIESTKQFDLKNKEYNDRVNASTEIKSWYHLTADLSTDDSIGEIEKKYHEYKSKKEQRTTLQQTMAVSSSQLQSIQDGIEKLVTKIQDITASIDKNKQLYAETIEEKHRLFGDVNIEEKHKLAHQILQTLHSNLQSFTKQLQNKKEVLASVDSKITKINDEILQYIEPRIAELREQKTLLVTTYNFSSEDEVLSSTMKKEFIENAKNDIQNFKKKFDNLHYDKNQTTLELEKFLLSKPTESIDELQTLILSMEAKQRGILEELGAKKLLKEQNESRKLQFEQYKSQYELQKTITNRWNKLNSFIGSNDGKKYQRIVQRITMARLLEYTNIHLKEFSNRYSVSLFSSDNDSTNQSLVLLIQDNDNNGKLRQVSTLSGGETFLVSLSMALGIATMISSSIEVESLFLDEGFGTLDSHTLEIVMLALENLQQRGRKIGIISHVEQLKERISTQIVVQALGNGTSTVFIREN